MPRPPKPTMLLELTGALRHDKKRHAGRSASRVDSGPLGAPPAHWDKPSSYPKGALAAIWLERQNDYPEGLLGSEHRGLFEQLCVATFESRRIGKQQIRWSAEVTKITRLLGMTPVDAAKIELSGVRTKKPAGKLVEFQRRKRTG